MACAANVSGHRVYGQCGERTVLSIGWRLDLDRSLQLGQLPGARSYKPYDRFGPCVRNCKCGKESGGCYRARISFPSITHLYPAVPTPLLPPHARPNHSCSLLFRFLCYYSAMPADDNQASSSHMMKTTKRGRPFLKVCRLSFAPPHPR